MMSYHNKLEKHCHHFLHQGQWSIFHFLHQNLCFWYHGNFYLNRKKNNSLISFQFKVKFFANIKNSLHAFDTTYGTQQSPELARIFSRKQLFVSFSSFHLAMHINHCALLQFIWLKPMATLISVLIFRLNVCLYWIHCLSLYLRVQRGAISMVVDQGPIAKGSPFEWTKECNNHYLNSRTINSVL